MGDDIKGEIERDGDPIIGLTAEIDGRVAAYGGLRLIAGHHFAFFDVTDEAARRPFLLHRTTMAAILSLGRAGIGPVYTFCDESKPNAAAWLRRLGFRPLQQHEKSAVMIAAEEQNGHGAWILEA